MDNIWYLPCTNLGVILGGIDWWLNVTCNLSVTPAISLFLTLDVTVLVPVGTQLHGRDSHAGLSCQLAPDSGWDSHAGASPLASWYLPSMAGLPRWYSNAVTLTLQSYSQVTQLPSMTQVTPKLILPRIQFA